MYTNQVCSELIVPLVFKQQFPEHVHVSQWRRVCVQQHAPARGDDHVLPLHGHRSCQPGARVTPQPIAERSTMCKPNNNY